MKTQQWKYPMRHWLCDYNYRAETSKPEIKTNQHSGRSCQAPCTSLANIWKYMDSMDTEIIHPRLYHWSKQYILLILCVRHPRKINHIYLTWIAITFSLRMSADKEGTIFSFFKNHQKLKDRHLRASLGNKKTPSVPC